MDSNNKNRTIEPYLFFNGCCEEALEFYLKTLGAEIEMIMRFKESPTPTMAPPGSEEKIMHSSFLVGKSRVMASDGHCQGKANFQGFSLSVAAANETEADRLFAGLGEGGQVQMPLAKTFYSPRFGMVTDRFGVMWMVIVPA